MTALAVGNLGVPRPTRKTSVGKRISNPADPHLFRHDAEIQNATVNVKDNPIVNKGGKEIVVRAEVGIPGQKPVNMDFTTYQSGGKYRTYNVAIEGASLVTVYRNQFGEIIKAKGIDGLIAELKAKTAANNRQTIPSEGGMGFRTNAMHTELKTEHCTSAATSPSNPDRDDGVSGNNAV